MAGRVLGALALLSAACVAAIPAAIESPAAYAQSSGAARAALLIAGTSHARAASAMARRALSMTVTLRAPDGAHIVGIRKILAARVAAGNTRPDGRGSTPWPPASSVPWPC